MSFRRSRRVVAGAAGAAALSLAFAPLAQAAGFLVRLSGPDRAATAVEVSQLGHEEAGSASAVVLVRADLYADALTGSALAAAKEAPLLLTDVSSLPETTADEIERVLADDGIVYVLGGSAAVDDAVVDAVEALGADVKRVKGADRYGTALAVADEIGTEGPVFLSTGTNFPDALAAGAAAGSEGGVVLLTRGEQLPNVVADHLEGFDGDVYAIGGPAAKAASGLEDVMDVVGADRYATAVEVATEFFDGHPEYDGFVLASGEKFPDALAGGASSGRNHDPVLLTKPDSLPEVTAEYLTRASEKKLLIGIVLGGEAAVSDEVVVQTDKALNPPPTDQVTPPPVD